MVYRVVSYDIGERCSVQDEENGFLNQSHIVFIVVISHSVFVSEMKLFVRLTLCVFSSYNIMSSSPISYST